MSSYFPNLSLVIFGAGDRDRFGWAVFSSNSETGLSCRAVAEKTFDGKYVLFEELLFGDKVIRRERVYADGISRTLEKAGSDAYSYASKHLSDRMTRYLYKKNGTR